MLVGRRMTPDPITVSPDLPIADALEEMRQKNVRRFPVLNKKGKLVGIVTQNDLLYAAPSSVTLLSMNCRSSRPDGSHRRALISKKSLIPSDSSIGG